MFTRLFQKKIIGGSESSETGLKRTLGVKQLIALGIGAIIGAGIFVYTGQAAAEFAGPGVIFSFIFAAIICVFAAFCYAEFASLIPTSGGPYAYAYATLGEFAAWVIGWGLTLEYLVSASAVAVSFSGYFSSFMKDFGIALSTAWTTSPLQYEVTTGWAFSGSYLNIPAMLIVAFIGGMVSIGIRSASLLNNIMVAIKLVVIFLFIALGVFFINTDNWVPLIPENTGVFGEFGWSGIFRGAGLIFFAYIGFDSLSTLGNECRNPQKDLPIGMMASLGISTLLYVIVSLVLTGVVSYKLLSVPDPFSIAIDVLGSKFVWLRLFVKLAILAALCSVLLVMFLGQTRIFFSMSQDGLLPKFFGKIHPKFETPFKNSMLVLVVAMILAGTLPVVMLGQLVSMGALFAFAFVCFSVLVLHFTEPNLKRPFRTPFSPWVPLIGTLICIFQMCFLPMVTWMQLLVWMIVGIAVYFCYGIKHSKLTLQK